MEPITRKQKTFIRKSDPIDDNWPYDDPHTLNYTNIDEPIRNLCKQINQSKWLKTGESCAGHPIGPFAWSPNTYLRLITTDLPWFFRLIDHFNEGLEGFKGFCEVQYSRNLTQGYEFYVNFPKPKDEFERNLMIDLFMKKFVEIEALPKSMPHKQ